MKKRPVFEGEIVGRRSWTPRTVNGVVARTLPNLRLGSVSDSGWWNVGVNEARCLGRFKHRVPDRGCQCGLYAFYDGMLYGGVEGLVTAWGDVELHPDGFRAEFARVAALVAPDPENRFTAEYRIAAFYGVPVITREQFEDDAFIAEFGEIVPREMRPEPSHRNPPSGLWWNRRRRVASWMLMGFWSVGLGLMVAGPWRLGMMLAVWASVALAVVANYTRWLD